jgi:hypothetical protein
MGLVDVAELNVRAGPGTDYPIVATVPVGTPFTVLGQDPTGGWLYVSLSNGGTGWVDRSLTTFAGLAPVLFVPAPPVPTPIPTAVPTATPVPATVSAPTVQLLAPGANASFVTGNQLTVQWTATDNSGIALSQVQLLVDNSVVQSTAGNGQTSLQASQQWQATSVGSHTISVIATDVQGNASAPASVTIYVTASSTTSSLAVYFTQPTGNIVVVTGQGVTINSTASGPNGVIRIELWVDGSLYTSTSSGVSGGQSPYSVSQGWSSTALGEHTIFVRAWDSAGNSANSGSLTIGVADNNPPQLSVSFNATTVNVGQAVVVNTTATDSKGVTNIELWVNGTQVAVNTSGSSVGQSQLSASQTWVPGSAGQYSVYVTADDSTGLSSNSGSTTVSVVGATVTPAPTATPVTPTPTMTPTPTGTPVPTVTPASTETPMPTNTPMPTSTPAPPATPRPGPPSAAIIRPAAGFVDQLPASIAFTIQARGAAQLARIELWGQVPGQGAPQLLQTFNVAGRYVTPVGFNYNAPAAGPASFYAIAYDRIGQTAQSATTSGTILAVVSAPLLPTPAAVAEAPTPVMTRPPVAIAPLFPQTPVLPLPVRISPGSQPKPLVTPAPVPTIAPLRKPLPLMPSQPLIRRALTPTPTPMAVRPRAEIPQAEIAQPPYVTDVVGATQGDGGLAARVESAVSQAAAVLQRLQAEFLATLQLL